MPKRFDLDLRDLRSRCRLSPGALANCTEAASVMLDKFWAVPPPATPASIVSDGTTQGADLWWTGPDDAQRGTHANELDATRDGAYAVAIAAVHAVHGYVVRRRPLHGSGADYVMTRAGEPENDFVKLEVSGTARGDDAETRARLAQKVAQVGGGDLDRPGMAVVVAFQDAIIKMQGVS